MQEIDRRDAILEVSEERNLDKSIPETDSHDHGLIV